MTGYRIRRVGSDGRSLARLLEPHQPRSSALISGLLEYPERRHRRAWQIDNSDGGLSAAVVAIRQCFDTWVGFVYIAEASAGPTVALLVDRLAIVAVAGTAVDIEPLVGRLDRSADVFINRWAVVRAPVSGVFGAPSGQTRRATDNDLEALVELYSSYEYVQALTVWQLRSHLRTLLRRHTVVVFESGEAIVGAVSFTGSACEFAMVNELTVAPEHRRLGVAWELIRHVASIVAETNLGMSMVIAPSNPMSMQSDRVSWADDYATISLLPLQRFRGQERLRSLCAQFRPIEPRSAQNLTHPQQPTAPKDPTELEGDRSANSSE